jgi:hypothetical protein
MLNIMKKFVIAITMVMAILVVLVSVASAESMEPVNVPTSQEASNLTIVTNDEGEVRTMLIQAKSLKKMKEGTDFVYVTYTKFDGINLLVNYKGVIGEVYGREKKATNYRRQKNVPNEKKAASFFSKKGYVKSLSMVREGYEETEAVIQLYKGKTFAKVVFVQLAGEKNFRMVVAAGSSSSSKKSGGSSPSSPSTTTSTTSNPEPNPKHSKRTPSNPEPNPQHSSRSTTTETSNEPAPSHSKRH